MAKLWAKDYQLDSLIEEFTVGSDYVLDLKLIPSDCVASMAHAEMLSSIGILTIDEKEQLKNGLKEVLWLHEQDKFSINREDEDGHTAIENFLTKHAGDAGKKIHTGRSRNDQVITAIRVYSRSLLLIMVKKSLDLCRVLSEFGLRNARVPMPGRTHMQAAMPSSVGLWAGAWAEQLMDDTEVLLDLFKLVDQCPLGSAASYGVPLPLNREMTADLLGFGKVQNNVLYVNNSRGKMESMMVNAMEQMSLTLSKSAQDLILFSLPEFSYFTLPKELCSGSSIMPQKKNPDGLELMRSKSAVISSYASRIRDIIRSLPSGYNRDFQDTKEPFLKGGDLIMQCIDIMNLTFSKLEVNENHLREAFTPEIYATDAALEQVASGKSFRDAYKHVGMNLGELNDRDPVETIMNRTYTGTTGSLGLEDLIERIVLAEDDVKKKEDLIQKRIKALMGRDVSLLA